MRLPLFALSLLTLAPSAAVAQSVSEAARERFFAAEEAFEADDYALALEGYEATYQLMDGHPRQSEMWFNIARCQDRLGRAEPAIVSYERFLAEAPGAESSFREEAETRLVALRLRSDQSGADTGPEARTEASWANWLIAGGLLALAVTPIALASWTVATDGECVESDDAGCIERVQFGAVDVVGYVLGGLAVVGAITFAIAQPIQVEVSATQARLVVRGRF